MEQIYNNYNQHKEKTPITIPAKTLFSFEQITNKTRNIKIHLCVVKMIDTIMRMKWFQIRDEDTWSLIYFVNYIFHLHDVFIGSFIA